MENNDFIRSELKRRGIRQWRLADAVGISEPQMVRWLRHPLPEDRFIRVMDAMDKLTSKGAENGPTEEKVDGQNI